MTSFDPRTQLLSNFKQSALFYINVKDNQFNLRFLPTKHNWIQKVFHRLMPGDESVAKISQCFNEQIQNLVKNNSGVNSSPEQVRILIANIDRVNSSIIRKHNKTWISRLFFDTVSEIDTKPLSELLENTTLKPRASPRTHSFNLESFIASTFQSFAAQEIAKIETSKKNNWIQSFEYAYQLKDAFDASFYDPESSFELETKMTGLNTIYPEIKDIQTYFKIRLLALKFERETITQDDVAQLITERSADAANRRIFVEIAEQLSVKIASRNNKIELWLTKFAKEIEKLKHIDLDNESISLEPFYWTQDFIESIRNIPNPSKNAIKAMKAEYDKLLVETLRISKEARAYKKRLKALAELRIEDFQMNSLPQSELMPFSTARFAVAMKKKLSDKAWNQVFSLPVEELYAATSVSLEAMGNSLRAKLKSLSELDVPSNFQDTDWIGYCKRMDVEISKALEFCKLYLKRSQEANQVLDTEYLHIPIDPFELEEGIVWNDPIPEKYRVKFEVLTQKRKAISKTLQLIKQIETLKKPLDDDHVDSVKISQLTYECIELLDKLPSSTLKHSILATL